MAKVVLDEETKEALLGLLPFSADATYEFTPQSFQAKDDNGQYYVGAELWPVFILRPLTKPECDQTRKFMIDEELDPHKVDYDNFTAIIRKAIKGWRNLIDVSSGDEIECKVDAGGIDRDSFNKLTSVLVLSIWTKLKMISGLMSSEKLGLGY